MKKRILTAAITALLADMLTACGGEATTGAASPAQGAGSAATATAQQADTAKKDDAAKTEGDLGDYHVKILDAETGLKDYEGNDVIGIKYEFTNGSEDNQMFGVAVNPQAFQDGVQLEVAMMDKMSDEANNSLKEIKKGATITCEDYYVLTSKSDVEVEVSETISFSDEKLEKSFKLSE